MSSSFKRWRRGGELGLVGFYLLASLAIYQRTRRFQKETFAPASHPLADQPPLVSIIVPMRNEEQHVDTIISSLLKQDYPNVELLVMDDGSTDQTAALVQAWQAKDDRIHLHTIAALPAGWAGKSHALHEGALRAKGEWLLFTDADTVHAPQTLRLMMGHARSHSLDLLSLLPDMQLIGPAMRLLTPIGIQILSLRATPEAMRSQPRAHAVAVGQYLLVKRATYVETHGYDQPGLRQTFADDVDLAEMIKQRGYRLDIVSGKGLVSNIQWTDAKSAWQGWRKSTTSLAQKMPLAMLAAALFFLGLGFAPLLALIWATDRKRPAWHRLLLALGGAGTGAVQMSTQSLVNRLFGLPLRWALAASAGWIAFGFLALDALRLARGGKGAGWKGRPVSK